MQAKVKNDYRWKTVVAFGGIEYVKNEWRPVPAGLEHNAQAHPFLDVNDVPAESAPVEPVKDAPVEAEPSLKPKSFRSRKE